MVGLVLKRQFTDGILERNSFVHKSFISHQLFALNKDSLNMYEINNDHIIKVYFDIIWSKLMP